MVAVIWDDDVWLPPNITWEYFDHDDRCSKNQLILKTGMTCCGEPQSQNWSDIYFEIVSTYNIIH